MGLFDWLFGKKATAEPRTVIDYGAKPKQEDHITELCKAANKEIADEVSRMDMMTTDLSEETLRLVREEIAKSAAKGQNPMNCGAVKYLPDHFKWAEYDEWLVKVKRMRRKPDAFDLPQKIVYVMTIMALAQETTRLQGWKAEGTTRVKLDTCSHSCAACRKIPKVYPIDQAPRVGYERHPGCRCCFMPMN